MMSSLLTHLQLYDVTTILVESLRRLQPLGPCNLMSIKWIELWKRHNDIITVAWIIFCSWMWGERVENGMIKDDNRTERDAHLCTDFPLETIPSAQCCISGFRRSSAHRWSWASDRACAAIRSLASSRFARHYLLQDLGTRVFSICEDFLIQWRCSTDNSSSKKLIEFGVHPMWVGGEKRRQARCQMQWISEKRKSLKSDLHSHRFFRLNSIAAAKSSAHDTSPERARFCQCSPDAAKAPRDWRWAAHCARTFCESTARWLERIVIKFLFKKRNCAQLDDFVLTFCHVDCWCGTEEAKKLTKCKVPMTTNDESSNDKVSLVIQLNFHSNDTKNVLILLSVVIQVDVKLSIPHTREIK